MTAIDTFFLELALAVGGKWKLLDAVIIFAGKHLHYFFVALVIAVVFFHRKKWLSFLAEIAGAALLSRLAFVELIRFLWHRDRPFVEHQFTPLIEHDPMGSFPSAHASLDFALAAVVYFYNKKLGMLFFAVSTIIAFSRVFAGIHWFSDVLAGAFIGLFSGWVVVMLGQKIWPRLEQR